MAPNNRSPHGIVGSTLNQSEELSHRDNTKRKLELLYDGVYYDISDWIHRHPGGSVIKMYASQGEDATHAVQQFHHRSSKKVMGIMKSLPHRSPTQHDKTNSNGSKTAKDIRHDLLTVDFLKLYQELQDEGLFEPSYRYAFLRCAEVCVMFFTSVYLLSLRPLPFWIWFPSLIMGALGTGRAGWLVHEFGHSSFIGIPRLEKIFESFFIGFMFGFSSSFWNSQHNRHHAGPQHLKYDVDLKTLPLVAFNSEITKKKSKSWSDNIFIRHQKWLFYSVTILIVAFAWTLVLHPIHVIRKRKWMDMFFMSCHHFLLYYYVSIPETIIVMWLASLYMFGNFTLSHTHLPVTNEPTHWVEYSLVHTMNIKSGWMNIIDHWMGYLNYQIEHHLFPTMPQFRNKLCRDRVKALAKKHGLPYHLTTYTDAVQLAWNNLDQVSKELFA